MATFLELINQKTIKIYLDLLENKTYNHQDWQFQWITYEPCLSQHDRQAHHHLTNSENQESVLWLIDGLIEVNVGPALRASQSELRSSGPALRASQSSGPPLTPQGCELRYANGEAVNLGNLQSIKYPLGISEGFVVTGLQNYQITVRSAWSAQILLISRTSHNLDDPLTSNFQHIKLNDIHPIGKYGIWRSFSEEVRNILGIDRINLIAGHSGFSWLGAKYLASADFRIILCQFPAGKSILRYPEIGLLPSFINQGQDDLIFIGLEGFIHVMVDGVSKQWITCGKLLVLQPKQKISFIDRGRDGIKFLVLSSQKNGSLASNLLLETKVLNILSDIQGPFWSRLSWPIFKNSGIVFEEAQDI